MKKLFVYIIFLLLVPVLSKAEKIPLPELKSPVTDLTGTLSENEIDLLQQKLLSFESDSTAQIAVLIISTTGEETIEEYSMRLAEQWKIGFEGKDNGIIILVAKDDRTIRIEIGYGLEHKITDSDASEVIENEIAPEFQSGDFYSGINSGIDQLIFLINYEPDLNNFYSDIEYNYANSEDSSKSKRTGLILSSFIFLFIAKLVILFFSRSKLWILIGVILIFLAVDLFLGYIGKDFMYTRIQMIYTGILSFFPLIFNIFKIPVSSSGSSYSSYKSFSSSNTSSSLSSSSSSSWGSSSGSSYSSGGGSFGGGGASGSW